MSEKKYNIVYLYKESKTDALRYSLRSLKNIPVDKVVIVGDKPSWMTNVTHIPFAFGSSKILNEWRQMLLACEIVDDFLLFNDDFFILKPLGSYCYHKSDMNRPSSAYFKAYTRTKKLFKAFKNFEVHAPMYFKSSDFKKLENEYNIKRGYLHRSLYGNHFKNISIKTKDNKIRHVRNIESGLNKPFASTVNKIERNPEFISRLRKIFPKKSMYENNDIH